MFKSLKEICLEAEEKGIEFWEVILQNDMKERMITREQSMEQMRAMYQAMKDADANYDGKLRSASGLVGSDGEKFHEALASGETICGPFIGTVIEKALKMGESNACMKRIVAAPTAGACGVVPALFLTMQEQRGYTDEEMTKALYVAAGVGGVIANRAFLAGAAGGCQAEIGAGSSMAAAGAVYLAGGSNEAIIHAAAMAMKNLLGLACDPVAGLVEVPCVKRNVVGSVNALSAADMALAGIRSVIPPDEVYDAMRSVGIAMPDAVRETGKGGLAATVTGQAIAERINKE
ncbi:MAG: L-serine ammonia-lyase, iron-sulfur-dependent, subunit alpha [Lachnospiraceae bacterium]|nr:L-serine ammonia-lyase, iron-sulfur-dependent, subunit alpha [Lachnospiraceae bacterium]